MYCFYFVFTIGSGWKVISCPHMSEICVKYDSTNMNRRLAYATRRSWKLLNFFSLLFFLWELFSVKINGWFIGGFLKIRHMKNASHNFTDLIQTRTYFTSMFWNIYLKMVSILGPLLMFKMLNNVFIDTWHCPRNYGKLWILI